MRLLEKNSPDISSIYPHGTRVVLTIRPSAEMPNVIDTAKHWIVVPGCEVLVSVDDEQPEKVGFESPKEALESFLISENIISSDEKGKGNVRVFQKEKNGVKLAYAARWSEYFKEWEFVRSLGRDAYEKRIMTGTCIEGIRISVDTPGFLGVPILAICNNSGPNSPRTNVVRTGFEMTQESKLALRNIYKIYSEHIKEEIRDLHEERGFSLTRATQESRWLISALIEHWLMKIC